MHDVACSGTRASASPSSKPVTIVVRFCDRDIGLVDACGRFSRFAAEGSDALDRRPQLAAALGLPH